MNEKKFVYLSVSLFNNSEIKKNKCLENKRMLKQLMYGKKWQTMTWIEKLMK